MNDNEQVHDAPEWAEAVIIAELEQDESDSMTDYFAVSRQRTLLRRLVEQWEGGCEESGNLACDILGTLGVEWV